MRIRSFGGIAAQLALCFAFLCSAVTPAAELNGRNYSVELTATVSENPSRITLNWVPNADASGYRISRKLPEESVWRERAVLDRSQGGWTDSEITAGMVYEYQVIKTTANGYTGYGYIAAALKRQPVENRGKLILLTESSLAAALPRELQLFKQDLVGDGWTVVDQTVSKTQTVTSVKALIKSIYDADPLNTTGLLLLGHVAVPYSGNIMPDIHDDHRGAWPADVYYGDFAGTWTDSAVNTTNSTSNPNKPGDGKFDQDRPPGEVKLQIGRIDLSNLTCFANKTPARSEIDLTRAYLNKNHLFRHKKTTVQRKALLFDRQLRGLEPESQSSMAWRSFPTFFGSDQIRVIGQFEYFPILADESYLWSYVCSGGSQYGSDYIGSSDAWALNEPKVVFTSFLGSYYGDWDRESNFMRAALGTSGYTLTAIYGGQPQWVLHPMAIGETIGYCARITQNNAPGGTYPPQINAGSGEVHTALLGDPTLRLHPVPTPTDLSGNATGAGMELVWARPADRAVVGFHIYKSPSPNGPFARISGNSPVTTTNFVDLNWQAGDFYMVRALKIESASSGSYYNLSQGVFYPDPLRVTPGAVEKPSALMVSKLSPEGLTLGWLNGSGETSGIEIQRRALPAGEFASVGIADGSAFSYTDAINENGRYAYRVRALAGSTASDWTSELPVNLERPTAQIIGLDRTTSGNWIGVYGKEGYIVPLAGTNLPSYVQVGFSNVTSRVGSWDSSADPETPWYPNGGKRILSSMMSAHRAPIVFEFRFNDSLKRRLSFYMLDYKTGVRAATVDVMNPLTGEILSSTSFNNFTNGVYVNIDVQNFADVRVTPSNYDHGTYVNCIFFDSPQALPADAASADSFVRTDDTTGGEWQTRYGTTGYHIANGPASLPPFVQLTPHSQTWVWTQSTSDARALSLPGGGGRLAACWYTASEMNFEVEIQSNSHHEVALYFLDWDRAGRSADVIVRNSSGGILAQQRVENFSGGKYLVFKMKGRVQVGIRRVSGPNTTVSGIFFGPAISVSTAPPSLGLLYSGNASPVLRITGQPGQSVDIEASSDFRLWNKVDRVELRDATVDLALPRTAAEGLTAFRAVLGPE